MPVRCDHMLKQMTPLANFISPARALVRVSGYCVSEMFENSSFFLSVAQRTIRNFPIGADSALSHFTVNLEQFH